MIQSHVSALIVRKQQWKQVVWKQESISHSYERYPLLSTDLQSYPLLPTHFSMLSVITNAAETKMKNFDSQSNRARNLRAILLLSGEKEQSDD